MSHKGWEQARHGREMLIAHGLLACLPQASSTGTRWDCQSMMLHHCMLLPRICTTRLKVVVVAGVAVVAVDSSSISISRSQGVDEAHEGTAIRRLRQEHGVAAVEEEQA